MTDDVFRRVGEQRWRREWKVELIEAENPQWVDLYGAISAVPDQRHPVFMGPG